MTTRPDAESILVVDDAEDTLEVIRRNLASKGYRVFTARGVEEAVRLLEQAPVDLVVTDLKMPRASGMDLVRHVRENLASTEVMTITGYATVPGAVEAMKEGAAEYLAKPFTDEELFGAVGRALARLRARRAARPEPVAQVMAPGLLGASPAMEEVMRMVAKAAASEATALITGESGSGKEMVARAIHYNSARASAPFVAVNCGGIPEGLLESELFGHARGAFTGAVETRAGFFQTADGGTIFLDEIGDTSPAMQAKLLRVLEDRQVFMVGSAKPRAVDVRILAATNKDLRALSETGVFREDLYYRLNVVPLRLPPLRERGDDTLLLARHFLSRFAREHGRPAPRLTDRAIQALQSYHWPKCAGADEPGAAAGGDGGGGGD